MKLLILISALAVVNSKPYTPTSSSDHPTVQIEKQEVHEIILPQSKTLFGNAEDQKRAKNTQEILDKIVEVNRRHGLTPKGLKTNQDYVQLPTLQRSGTAKQQNFQFPQNPFSNPILDYLNADNNIKTRQNTPSFSTTNTNAEINPEDNIPGQFIKRKVTHHQTFIIPGGMMGNYNPNGQMQNMWYPNQPLSQNPQSTILPSYLPSQNVVSNSSNSSQLDTVKKTLENQTVENIKNIINTQLPPQMLFNPYAQNQIPQYYPQPFYSLPRNDQQNLPEIQPENTYSYRLNGPNANIPNDIIVQQFTRPGRQWEWPLAQYFPIVIKDPFQQIFNAFTSMIEYGQQGNALCADEQTKGNEKSGTITNRLGKNLKNPGVVENKPLVVDIENLEMTGDPENPIKLTFKYLISSDTKRTEKEILLDEPRVNTKIPQFPKNVETESSDDTLKGLINIKHKDKEDKDKVKVFSKDSTGSGVFIHKLRVRKGGVAIAGPGGIATAGSGGTAIVGPNGYAYTQPDSIAIAGSGTKVIAVDPEVDLTELINNVKKDKTGAINTRIGKIVAIGPTVYYNKG